ncbi:GH12 family glycosyl hydrolase domain-containing protein [Glycomyces rhizosphaerae]|uniref:Glycosyl hydrolase family 12 n=1 Tax=Glycomyces rhizosphaerae TaxID=2054422 RepID=A0ABV7PUV3_9ACTN
MRRRTLFTAGAVTAVAGVAAVSTLPAWAQTSNDEADAAQAWESSDQWGNWTEGDYTFYNNIWGSGAGSQTIWANGPGDWGVRADHPNTGGIKSYPNVSYTLGRNVSEMGQVTSTNAVTVPTGDGLAYNTAYDVWGNGHEHEIMIWTNWYGPVGPIGGQSDEVELGGQTWAYHQGSNGANAVYSFLATSQSTNASIDITGHCQWLVAQGHMPEVRIDQIQFGWEITSAAGGHDFTVNDYSLTA